MNKIIIELDENQASRLIQDDSLRLADIRELTRKARQEKWKKDKEDRAAKLRNAYSHAFFKVKDEEWEKMKEEFVQLQDEINQHQKRLHKQIHLHDLSKRDNDLDNLGEFPEPELFYNKPKSILKAERIKHIAAHLEQELTQEWEKLEADKNEAVEVVKGLNQTIQRVRDALDGFDTYASSEYMTNGWAQGVLSAAREIRKALEGDIFCHCGKPVKYGFDGVADHTRGMCAECDAVRCDAEPGACGN